MDEAFEKRWRELEAWRQQHPHATMPEIAPEIAEAVNEHIAEMRSQVDWSLPAPVGKWAVVGFRSQETDRIASKRPEKTDGFPLRENFSLPLWKRIRAWCQYANWYGPGWFTEASPSDPRTGFAFPPATEAQLRQTEQRMGYPHPPLLRALYLHVANGGFGPWEGLIGIPGGREATFHLHDPRYEETMQDSSMLLFDLEQREKMADNSRLICPAERE